MKNILFVLVLCCGQIFAQESTFLNPIIPGGHPDPSICRAGDEFYIVNSSFEYFPGLPIHKSTDLVNWELVGYGLHREDQCNGIVNLVDVQSDGGIHAPTIRYNKGLFYIITTNVYYNAEKNETDFVNFIITAENVEGPWSEPHHLEGAPGIDPDIFFDDDGRVWYVGTHSPENPNFEGEGEIWLQEIDLEKWELTGERSYLWRGACDGVWVEGPHMYKRNGKYYLLVAEGGTSFNHAVMIAVSDNIRGPYLSNERNPILSTRHLSYDNWVHSTGHADLIELEDGRWYMTALGIRGDEDRGSNMGRETHLVPVQWEREPFEWKEVRHEWPVCAPLTGKVERHNSLPFEEKKQFYNDGFTDNFDRDEPDLEWNFRRVPQKNTLSLSENPGYLRLYAEPEIIKERGQASLMGIRQKESDFEYSASMHFAAEEAATEAGICLFQKDENYISLLVGKDQGIYKLKLVVKEQGKEHQIIKEQNLESYSGQIIMKVVSKSGKYEYFYSLDKGKTFANFSTTKSTYIVSKKYTGAYLGIYATGNGQKTKDFADFDWVKYKGHPRIGTK